MTGAPDVDRLREMQHRLSDLAARVETEPRNVLAAIPDLLEELSASPQREAYLWCLHIAAQALRFVDDLDRAVATAELALEAADENSGIAAGLHLEAGMALNQRGSQSTAEPHLRAAARTYRDLGDQGGEAWALVALADALCGLARQDEALDLVTEAESAARAAGDDRALMRAFKQQAVVRRQRGELGDALVAVDAAVEGTEGHARANALLERGHILAMSQNYTEATDAYVAASVVYAAFDDALGLANAERALATVDLLLGRDVAGLRHLDAAANLYRRLGNATGLGYALRDRSIVRLSLGDPEGADADATEAVTRFTPTGDLLGLTGAWRAAARVAHATGRPERAIEALEHAEDIARRADNALALAGARLMQAEIGPPGVRPAAAADALALYDRLDIPTGAAHAAAFSARAVLDRSSTEEIMGHLETAASRLRRARRRVVDPARRADHDLSLRDVTATVVELCAEARTEQASTLAADALLEDFPLGLRVAFTDRRLPREALELADRARQRSALGVEDPQPLRALLRRVAVATTTLPTGIGEGCYRATLQQLRLAAPNAAILLAGAPISSGRIPIVHALPDEPASLELPRLAAQDVESIDALGRVVDTGASEILWHPDAVRWQETLSDIFLPAALRAWIASRPGSELIVVAHPTVAHVPFEALLVAPLAPLGAIVAVRRAPVPVLSGVDARCERVVAFFDRALDWSPEQRAVGSGVPSLGEWLSEVAPESLAVVGVHGEAAPAFEGWLTTTDGTALATAADLLTTRLDHSVVMFEACWSGRHAGHRTGETLNMTTAALLAGATTVIAGLWALPADPACTGRVAAECLTQLLAGIPPAEALRIARVRYLAEAGSTVRVPGSGEARMPGVAPWAWAGLCAYG